jgi:hypothetical protein
MPEASLISVFVKPLNQASIEYMVTGSVASILYGEPRMTHDIDLVIKLSEDDVSGLSRVFPNDQFYCPPTDVILSEISREVRGHFNLIHHQTGLKADLYPIGKDPLHQWAMGQRRTIEFDNDPIWVAPPEYVIIRKLDYFREGGSEKHLTDIKKMLKYSGDIMDMSILKEKAALLSLQEQLNKVLSPDC